MNKYELYVNNKIISKDLKLADTFLTRLKGLMFSKELLPEEGLIIDPCNSIHMCFMNYPLDVIFVNEQSEICALVKNIKPWRISKLYPSAKYVIELPAGTISTKNIQINQKILLKPIDF